MISLKSMVMFALLFATIPACHAQTKRVAPADAKDHVGEHATVCGKVVSAHYAKTTKGEPTFLNLDEPYPHQIFTILIWGSDRNKFGTPETRYHDAQVCVTGTITSYKGSPEVVASDPGQIQAKE
jgi:hypothetical protein